MSIFSLLRSGETSLLIIIVLSRMFVVLCCMPVHEMAHAYAAYKCGDDTAKLKGRLTINPFAHLDLIGTLMILFFGIGYANPVPVNPARLKHPKKNMALISFAGPLANIIMSFIFIFLTYFLMFIAPTNNVIYMIASFFSYAAQVNVTLAVFNLIPIPPLDGSKILTAVLPDKIYFSLMRYERYIMIGLFVLLFLGVLNGPITWLSNILLNIISFIPSLIFG